MMAERRCGTCQYWQRHDGQEHRRDLATGECAYPLPICLPAEYRITPYAKAGKDCPTWHPKTIRFQQGKLKAYDDYGDGVLWHPLKEYSGEWQGPIIPNEATE